ncbi:hypothetical protein BH10ACT7_BH10ACT7_13930 [soil metagenome]
MTDVTPETPARKPRKGEVIEDAVIVEEPATTATPDPIVVEEPVVVEATKPEREVIYVQAPQAPRKLGNRGVGAAIAVASGIVFAAALALATALIGFFASGRFSFAFLTEPRWYIPTLFFIIGFVLLVLIANRAAWWAYIFGSILVGVFVYFGSIGLALLSSGIILQTPEQAAAASTAQLPSPFVIVSALLARETSLWVGSVIARRGRTVKARNAEARAAHEQELEEKRAEGERAAG